MATNPYAVNFGSIPFAAPGSNAFSGLGGSPQQALASLGPAYQDAYTNALNFNKALGDTINTGYNTAMTNQLAGQQQINDMIAGYGQSAKKDLIAQNTANQGAATQSMIDRGLGNYTVLDSAKRGYDLDFNRANLQLDDQLAAMRGNYMNQFNQQNTMQADQHLGFLERMSGNYPNAGLYGQLAQQAGAAQQSAANQSRINDAINRMNGTGGGMMQAPGGIGSGGQGRSQSSFNPYGGYTGVTPTGGGLYGGGGVYSGGGNPVSIPTGLGGGGGAYDAWSNDASVFDPFSPYYGGAGETYSDPWAGYDSSLNDFYTGGGVEDPYADAWSQGLFDASADDGWAYTEF